MTKKSDDLIIVNIPDAVYERALQIRGHKWEKNDDLWSAKNEYEMVSSRCSEGELEKAIYEHMTTEGWSERPMNT